MVEINEGNRYKKKLKKKPMSTWTNISYMQSFKTRTSPAGRSGPGTGPGGGKNPLRSWSGETRSTRSNPGETRSIFFYMLVAIKRCRFGLLKGQNTGENDAKLGTDENLINERRNQFELTKQKQRSRRRLDS
jgi:hypothetical protein